MYDCEADNDDELTFEEGDVIIILNEETEDDNWMEGHLLNDPNKRGLFPVSFVHMLSDWEERKTERRKNNCSDTSFLRSDPVTLQRDSLFN